ncbi:hypothetical protein [Bacillus thuringiensis]|uniref:hypothetical protein n=1 Tax=Bacillus thuringiensis TaxID=1428 RepID=UPI001CCC9B28|nr:hypothetical protein [Bacillus thuringiensis]MBZ8124586.1 hypothetical protein [Bacillus thuringiensis]
MKRKTQTLLIDSVAKECEEAFIKVAVKSNQFPQMAASELAKSRVMRRLYYQILDPLHIFPSQSDFSIAVAMEAIKMWDYQIDDNTIIHYSIAVYKEWIRNIISNNTLKEFLNSLEKNPLELSKINNDFNQIQELIYNKTELRKTFFSSYSTISNDFIKVWLPNEEGYVDWKEEFSVDVAVNPFLGFELGFFQTGYDYNYMGEERGRLTIVTYSPNNDRESAVFTNKKIGIETDEIIWLL